MYNSCSEDSKSICAIQEVVIQEVAQGWRSRLVTPRLAGPILEPPRGPYTEMSLGKTQN